MAADQVATDSQMRAALKELESDISVRQAARTGIIAYLDLKKVNESLTKKRDDLVAEIASETQELHEMKATHAENIGKLQTEYADLKADLETQLKTERLASNKEIAGLKESAKKWEERAEQAETDAHARITAAEEQTKNAEQSYAARCTVLEGLLREKQTAIEQAESDFKALIARHTGIPSEAH